MLLDSKDLSVTLPFKTFTFSLCKKNTQLSASA